MLKDSLKKESFKTKEVSKTFKFISLPEGLHNHSQSNHTNQTTDPTTPNLYSSSSNLMAAPCSTSNVRELQSILREIRFMTNRLKMKDQEDEVVADWKFAAMVIDRWAAEGSHQLMFLIMPQWKIEHYFHFLQVLPNHFHDLHDNHNGGRAILCSSSCGGIAA